ncbi:Rrf2 family transcriptional regulator, partial [Amaricoccus sp. HAR-UPW-R2A-40]
MRLDKHTDYALRVLMFLAANTDRLSTIAEIAGRFEISEAHLMKVVYRL